MDHSLGRAHVKNHHRSSVAPSRHLIGLHLSHPETRKFERDTCQPPLSMQVNVWVHVADPSSFAWHSKEFMAPVIAPAEAELAWRPLLPSFDDKAACSLCGPRPPEPCRTFQKLLLCYLRVVCHACPILRARYMAWPRGSSERIKYTAQQGGHHTHVYRVVETSSYAVDRDSDSSSSETHSTANVGALTSQGSRAVQPARPCAQDFLLKKRTYLGVETPATGAQLKPAALATAGMAGRAAAYSKETR